MRYVSAFGKDRMHAGFINRHFRDIICWGALAFVCFSSLVLACAIPLSPLEDPANFKFAVTTPQHSDSVYYIGDTLRLAIKTNSNTAGRSLSVKINSLSQRFLDTSMALLPGKDTIAVNYILSTIVDLSVTATAYLSDKSKRDTSFVVHVRGREPQIIAQSDTAITCTLGVRRSLFVNAIGTPPLHYQWHKNGAVSIADTFAALVFSRIQFADTGIYFCAISNGWNPPDTSLKMRIVVVDTGLSCQKPVIAPVSYSPDSFILGKQYVMSIRATGFGLQYQWYRNKSLLIGRTSDTLRIVAVSINDTGVYFCVAKNSCLAVDTSDNFSLHIAHLPTNHAPQFVTQPFTMVIAKGTTKKSDVAIIAQDTLDKDTVSYSLDSSASVLPAQSKAIFDSARYLLVTISSTAGVGNNYKVAIIASDNRGAKDTLTVSLTIFDSTVADTLKPNFTWKSGPHLANERVKTATGSIVYSIDDLSGLDTVYATVNGTSAGALAKLTGSDYSFAYDLGTHYHLNRIVLHARDKSIRHNEDSVAIVLDFNTVPSAAIPVFPVDNDGGIEPAGLTLRWSGGDDIDGDSVTFIVEYGIDGRFFTAASTRNKQLSLSGIRGGANYRWFILTSTAIDTVRSPTNNNTNYHFSTRNRKPQITFISPAAQQVFSAGDSVVLQVSVDDSDGVATIDSVTFDDKGIGPIQTLRSPGKSAVEYVWKNAVIGGHYVKAIVTDINGATAADSLRIYMVPGMRTIQAQGKTFTMGGTKYPADSPPHSVSFDYNFLIDTAEVPQRSYITALGVNPSNVADFTLPVYNLTWYDAAIYCNAMSKAYGMDTVYTYTGVIGQSGDSCELLGAQSHLDRVGFRLPTEAEWEYSCRANSNTLYFWGDTIVEDSIVFMNNSGCRPQYLPGKGRNAFGLYSMLGNLAEWCNDFYGSYSSIDVRNPIGPATGTLRILRGGSYITYSYSQLICEQHTPANPMLTASSDVTCGGFTGFRCVLPMTIPAAWKQ